MAAPLIIIPFANAGDVIVPPQSDPNGFVNFTSGYTPDYEINLSSGDPQAKAVERGVQNYLFQALTGNVQAWQKVSRPPWYANMPGGYPRYAEVNFPNAQNQPVPYRSTVDGNIASPSGGLQAGWSYIQSTQEMLSNVPMPSGGPAGPGSYLYTAPVDFNTLTSSGSFQFATDAVVTGSPNTPQNGGNKAGAGLLEVNAWSNAGSNYVTQFFRDRNGLGLMRGAVNGSWSIWKIWANATQFVLGEVRMWSGTATADAVLAAWGPGWRLCDGTNGTPNLADKFIVGASGSRPVASSGGSFTFTLSAAQMPVHNHVVNISDPGHAHNVYDPGHAHGVSDPGHAHGVYDPGHKHIMPWGEANNNDAPWGTYSSGRYGSHDSDWDNWWRYSSPEATNIGIYASGTGIGINNNGTGIGIYGNSTGISASSNNAGGGQAVTVVPPYYALCYVMFTGA